MGRLLPLPLSSAGRASRPAYFIPSGMMGADCSGQTWMPWRSRVQRVVRRRRRIVVELDRFDGEGHRESGTAAATLNIVTAPMARYDLVIRNATIVDGT